MHPRTRLVYFYFLRVELLLKTWSQGRCHIVRLPWQGYICRSKYDCFCLSPKVTYLHTKIEEGLKFFISNFASLSWRIALKFHLVNFVLVIIFGKTNFESSKLLNYSTTNCYRGHQSRLNQSRVGRKQQLNSLFVS